MLKRDRCDLSIIIVNWNTKEFLKNCLNSIYDQIKGIAFEVFVVDNASFDGSIEMVETQFLQVNLVRNDKNLGFSRANNQAIRQSHSQYILLLNPDTVILNGAINQMVDFLEDHPNVGAVGGKLLDKDGSVQVSYGNFPSLSVLLFNIIIPIKGLFLGKCIKSFSIRPTNVERPIPVDYISGACLMARRAVIKKVGLLDEQFSLYFEDSDWCYRMRQAGWDRYYLPFAQIIHYGKMSTEQLNDEGISKYYKSLYKFFRKHYGEASLFVLKCLISLGYGMRLIIYSLGWAVNFKERARIKQKINLYLLILRLVFKS